MRRSLVGMGAGVAALPGCFYKLEPQSRICEDRASAISERTYACEDHADLANARHAAFTDEAECPLPDEVDDPYHPDGALPASIVPEERERLERLDECVRAARQADCERVARRGDDLSGWLTLDPSCADVATAASVALGVVNLPERTCFGVTGRARPSVTADVLYSFDDRDAYGSSFKAALKFDDPDTLLIIP